MGIDSPVLGRKTDIANKLLRRIGKPVFFLYIKSGRRESDGWTDPRTVEIGGDTTKLQTALKDVTSHN